MPNGFYGSETSWREFTGALDSLDPELERFGGPRRLELLRNKHAWPGRELRWYDDLERAIEIYLGGEKRRTYSLGIAAALDKEGRRYWRGATLREGATIDELRSELATLLQHAYELVSSWRCEDLEDTGRVG